MDARTYIKSLNKSVQDKNNSKNKKIAGELYPGNGKEKAMLIGATMIGLAIIGVAGYMASKHSLAEDINATIDREINDEDNFILDQVRLAEKKEAMNYSVDDLYNSYKEAYQAIDNKEEGTNIVHFRDKDIEIDQTLVDYLLMENKDGFFSRSDKTAEALAVAGQYYFRELEQEYKQEQNNTGVRR